MRRLETARKRYPRELLDDSWKRTVQFECMHPEKAGAKPLALRASINKPGGRQNVH